MRYKYHPPYIIRKLFNNFIWETSNDKLLLTFDDGPTESATKKILNILSEYNIKAVFFCVGKNIEKHLGLVEKMLLEGHTVANHTMNHKLLTKTNWEGLIAEIEPFDILMKEKFNYDVRYLRPPHGRFNLKTSKLLKEFNLKCVMWSLLTYDFMNDINKVKYSIDDYLKRNSIIVFHDSVKCGDIIENSLNYAIERAVKNGFEFGEPEDCLK